MADQIYKVRDPQGNIREISGPAGATDDEIIAQAQKLFAAPPQTAPAPEVGMAERMFGTGSPLFRTVKGAVIDPALAVNQLLASTGLFGPQIKQGATQLVRGMEAATEQGRARVGSEGFDPYQLLGNVVSPVNRLVGITQAPLAAAPSAGARAVRSAGTGAVLAATQPVNAPVEQFGEKKLEQMALGAALGPVIEGGVAAVGALSQRLQGLTASGRQQFMRDELNKLAGPERDAVIRALQDAGEIVKGSRPTAAEAIADIPTATQLMAAQRKLSSNPELAGSFLQRTVDQQAARVRALQGISKTETDRLALESARTAETGPMREQAIALADRAKEALSSIDSRVNAEAGRLVRQTQEMSGLPYPTANLGVQQTARDIQRAAAETANSLKAFQLQSLKESGVFPVLATDITAQIDKAIQGTSSDLSKQVLAFARDRILAKADNNGILSSRDLYDNVRKTLNQDIQKLLQQGERFAQGGIPQQAAEASNNVKKLIDASLNKSTGGLWGNYLDKFQDYSRQLNRMEVGNYLSQKLQTPLGAERAGVFAEAVENAAQTIKASTGMPRYQKLSDVLTPNEVGAVNNVLADLKRSSKAEEFARKVAGLQVGMRDVGEELPNLLNRTLTLGKTALEYMQKGNAEQYNRAMAELLLNPQQLAQFMTEAVPKGRIVGFTSSLMKLMDPATRSAFVQSFAIPAAAATVGQVPQE
jgi:hypothetical protein